jgi:hypothetical protein
MTACSYITLRAGKHKGKAQQLCTVSRFAKSCNGARMGKRYAVYHPWNPGMEQPMVAWGIATSLSIWASRLGTWSSPAARGVSEVWCHSCTMLHYFIDKQQAFDLSGLVWSRFSVSHLVIFGRASDFFFAESACHCLNWCVMPLGCTSVAQGQNSRSVLRCSFV